MKLFTRLFSFGLVLACLCIPINRSLAIDPQDDASDAEVHALLVKLISEDDLEQLDAVIELGSIGPYGAPAAHEITKLMDKASRELQYECIVALGKIGPLAHESVGSLTKFLKSDSALYQSAALESLRQIGTASPEAESEIRQLCLVPNAAIATSAIRCLLMIEEETDEIVQKSIPRLVMALGDERSDVGNEAAVTLTEIGSSVVPAVTAALSDQNSRVRLKACDILSSQGLAAESAVPALLPLLQDKIELVVRAATTALGKIHSHPEIALPALGGLLRHESPWVRITAVRAISEFGPAANSFSTVMLELLSDKKIMLRSAAADALGRIGNGDVGVIDALVRALADADGVVTVSAANALLHTGSPAVPAMIRKLPEEPFRNLIVDVLGEMGPEAESAVPALVELLKTADENLKREIFIALATIGPKASAGTASMMQILGNPDAGDDRAGAAYVLAHIGEKKALPVLKGILERSQSPQVLRSAAWSIVQLDPGNPENAAVVMPHLFPAMSSEIPLVRKEAISAMSTLGQAARSAWPDIMEHAESDPDASVRAESLRAVAEIQAPVSETLPVALASLKDPDVTVRNASRYLLGRIGKEAQIAAPVLREALRRGDPLERIVSAWALVNVDSTPENIQAAIPMLLAGLRHPNPEVRTEVAITLGTTGTQSKDVLAELKFAANDSDPLVRQAAKEALTKLSHGN
ncbi:MAG TPA: HEAT repeat domain-containing protein [Planctomycetaceae bacterium]|nr:HEAT repeat domain-containing protein [Planctomycetaceae bacterium]